MIQSITQHGGARPEILETGIKVIDLLSPLVRGGTFGLFGPSGTGRMVVSAEVLRNVAHDNNGVTIFAFVHGEADARVWYDTPSEVPTPSGAGHMVCLPIDDSTDALSSQRAGGIAAAQVARISFCQSGQEWLLSSDRSPAIYLGCDEPGSHWPGPL